MLSAALYRPKPGAVGELSRSIRQEATCHDHTVERRPRGKALRLAVQSPCTALCCAALCCVVLCPAVLCEPMRRAALLCALPCCAPCLQGLHELVLGEAVAIVRDDGQEQRGVGLGVLAALRGDVGGAVGHGQALAGGAAPAQGEAGNVRARGQVRARGRGTDSWRVLAGGLMVQEAPVGKGSGCAVLAPDKDRASLGLHINPAPGPAAAALPHPQPPESERTPVHPKVHAVPHAQAVAQHAAGQQPAQGKHVAALLLAQPGPGQLGAGIHFKVRHAANQQVL